MLFDTYFGRKVLSSAWHLINICLSKDMLKILCFDECCKIHWKLIITKSNFYFTNISATNAWKGGDNSDNEKHCQGKWKLIWLVQKTSPHLFGGMPLASKIDHEKESIFVFWIKPYIQCCPLIACAGLLSNITILLTHWLIVSISSLPSWNWTVILEKRNMEVKSHEKLPYKI